MNTDTNELRQAKIELWDQLQAEGFEPVPDHLSHAARRKLNGRESAQVSFTSNGKLSRWAAKKRKKKRQMAKAARRANRHWGGK